MSFPSNARLRTRSRWGILGSLSKSNSTLLIFWHSSSASCKLSSLFASDCGLHCCAVCNSWAIWGPSKCPDFLLSQRVSLLASKDAKITDKPVGVNLGRIGSGMLETQRDQSHTFLWRLKVKDSVKWFKGFISFDLWVGPGKTLIQFA